METSMVIRVQSPSGIKRLDVRRDEKIANFLKKVQDSFIISWNEWIILRDRKDRKSEIKDGKGKTVEHYNLKHGDIVYLVSTVEKMEAESQVSGAGTDVDMEPVGSRSESRTGGQSITLDEVDIQLDKMDGKIKRQRSEQLCHHGANASCVHCAPLEPYDERYLSTCDPPIKYLSFHSYIRKLTGGVDKGKFAMLEDISCKIKPGCKEHQPWPAGICTKCQPSALLLNRQKYRHVDYIQFENPDLMDRFLNCWRTTGAQRLGYLYGRYEHHRDIPLAIKAVVAAIYEPPQMNTKNHIQLLEDVNEAAVEAVANKLGLRRVGWIFTDLVADSSTGNVKHFRGNIKTHFLSAEECIMAASFQLKYPNACKLSSDGYFGSKFVTVVVTGDASNNIHFEGYQVSNQCMALVRDDCLVPTRDAPELGYVKESSSTQYVPDVFFKTVDEYGNEVTQLARPLPVEYLLVDMAAAFPVNAQYTFHAPNVSFTFPVENRHDDTIQDFTAFSTYMQQFPRDQLLEAFSDFHVLIFMACCDMLPVKSVMDELLSSLKSKDQQQLDAWLHKEEWATVEQLISAHGGTPSPTHQQDFPGFSAGSQESGGASGSRNLGAVPSWNCTHCTYINSNGATECEMCGLPKY